MNLIEEDKMRIIHERDEQWLTFLRENLPDGVEAAKMMMFRQNEDVNL